MSETALKVSFDVCGIRFDVDPKYNLDHLIGTGAYGTICKGFDTEAQRSVAIKKIPDIFVNLLDAKRTLREIKLLRFLHNDYIVRLHDIMVMEDGFNDVYIVMDLMETDLRKVIKSDQPLTDDHCQYFLCQLLRAVKYMHSAGVIHRDLKPANILLDSHCNLKVCDFGLSRLDDSHHDFFREAADYTEYVVTRWYRAPEVIFERGAYSKSVDMWSVGCIFAEIIGRKPLFPGKDHVNQLSRIYRVLGTPSDEEISGISNQLAREHMMSSPYQPKIPLATLFPTSNPLAVDLMERMLFSDPSRRISAADALRHQYLAALHKEEEEVTAPEEMSFDYDERHMDEAVLRGLVFKEMMSFHPELEDKNARNATV